MFDKEDLKFFGIMGLLLGVVLAGCGLVVNFAKSYECGRYEAMTGKETRWVFLNDCYVKTDSGWQRFDEYKLRAAASEGLLGK